MFGIKKILPIFHQYIYNKSTSYKFLSQRRYTFSDNNKPQPGEPLGQPPQKQDNHQYINNNDNTEQGDNLTQLDKAFNIALQLPKNHSFRKQLVVSQKKYQKSIKQLREAILFEDLLKAQTTILIYDTHSKPYNWHLFKTLYMLIILYGGLLAFEYAISLDTKSKIIFVQMKEGQTIKIITSICIAYITIKLLFKHLRMNKRYVEKIIYDTKSQNFIFYRRGFFATRSSQEVSRFKILYTENPALIKRGTNYLNVDTKEQYFIGFDMAWKKQDLFSHLISQRIAQ